MQPLRFSCMPKGAPLPDEPNPLGERPLADLSRLVFEDLDEAVEALPLDEQETYREAGRSVVDARREAEANEGLLRIK